MAEGDKEISVSFKIPREMLIQEPRHICYQAMEAYNEVMDKYNEKNLRFVHDVVIVSVSIVVEEI